MNKIDELKRDIEFHKRGMEISKSLLANAEKDLAALEAQERRPLEFVIGIDKNGYPVSVGKRGTSILHHVQGGALSSEAHIVAIESKPVKVTREMAVTMHMATVHMGDDIGLVPRAVATLKVIGIEAEPSND